MQTWIVVTIAAAFFQNLRFMLQKHLKDSRLSTAGTTLTRFLYGAPLACLLVAVLVAGFEYRIPVVTPEFLAFALTGGLAQILATHCVIALFAERNFAVGIGFKKTETVQTAILSFLVLAEPISARGLAAILVSLVGVLLMSKPPRLRAADTDGLEGPMTMVVNRATGLGIAAGFLFGCSAIGYRGATLSLDGGDVLIRASTTLAFVTVFQALVLSTFVRLREPGQFSAVLGSWRVAGLVGLTSVLGSLGWFVAFALQNAAYVKAVGQIELLFTFAGSYFVFRERSRPREVAGILFVALGILLLIAR